MARNQALISRHNAALVHNYGKLPIALVRGEGSRLWDANGKEYLDFFAGFGGSILGHAHPALVAALEAQAHALWAVGNQFYSEPQIRLAEHLSAKAFPGQAFFCHSGAEAAEAALKLARLSSGGRFKVISCFRGFHGRTMGALSATPGYVQNGFAPLVPGFAHVPYGDLAALEASIDAQTCAVIMEPIQGEGGVNLPPEGYLEGVRKLCDKYNLCLILDEVWTGVGRTGRYFGHQHFNVRPDIMTMGKALGGGLPAAGILATPERAAFFKPGTHGCTLGGNPICMEVAATIFDVIEKENLLEKVTTMGNYIQQTIRGFKSAGTRIKQVRGKGLFIGVELEMADGAPVLTRALELGLVINITQRHIIRLCPSLAISQTQVEQGLALLETAIAGA
ncbi:MAG: acetylornithine/succinylornithine family transaminase [Phycisphaerae bacterium]